MIQDIEVRSRRVEEEVDGCDQRTFGKTNGTLQMEPTGGFSQPNKTRSHESESSYASFQAQCQNKKLYSEQARQTVSHNVDHSGDLNKASHICLRFIQGLDFCECHILKSNTKLS